MRRRWLWVVLFLLAGGVALGLRGPNRSEEEFLLAQFPELSVLPPGVGEKNCHWRLTGRASAADLEARLDPVLKGRPGWMRSGIDAYWMFTPYERPSLWPASWGYASPFDGRRHIAFLLMEGKGTWNPKEKPPREPWTFVSIIASRPTLFPKGGGSVDGVTILSTPRR